jgi:NADH-quinone oxidoreductase subunit L
MIVPMAALALITCVLGFGSVRFAEFLGEAGDWPSLPLIAMSTTVAAIGIATAWWFFGRPTCVINTRVYKERFPLIYSALNHKFYFDIVYDAVFIRPFFALTEMLANFDRTVIDGVVNGAGNGWVLFSSGSQFFDKVVIDGAVNGIATLSRRAGTGLRSLQTGRLQTYQRLILAAVVLLMLYLVVKGA